MTPKIRFNDYSDGWKIYPFEEIAKRVSSLKYDESIPSVEYEDIDSKSGKLNKDISKKAVHKRGQFFEKGDILFGKLRPYLHNNYYADFNGVAIGDFWIFKNGKATTSFIYPLISSREFSYVSNLSVGSKMPRADWGLVSSWKFHIPENKEEQVRIGQYFKLIDLHIFNTGKELQKLRQLKVSSLQSMFPQEGETVPRLRFIGFEGEWDERKLSEFLEISNEINNGNRFSRDQVLSVSGDYGVVNQIEFQGRSFAGRSISNYRVTHLGQLIYTKSPLKTERFGIIKCNQYGEGILSPLYAVYSVKEGVCGDFIHYYFSDSSKLNNYLNPLINKGAKNTILISDEEALEGLVQFPSNPKEQAKIADFFLNLDKQIKLAEKKLEKLKQIKSACLDLMFI